MTFNNFVILYLSTLNRLSNDSIFLSFWKFVFPPRKHSFGSSTMNGATHHQNRVISNHTIRSHGAKIARTHLYDWLVFVVLVVLEGVLQLIHPFNRFVSSNMMDDLKYPLKSNTIPIWAVPLYAVVLPIIIFIFYYFRKRNVYDLHNAILGILYAAAITAVITDTVKNAVGRLRPNFFWRCFPDGNEKYDNIGNAICDGVKSVIIEGRKSFPSGHSSMSFAGLAFLSFYLCGKMRVFDHNGHISKLCVVILPLLAATLVAVSRVDDYWHHWQDVLTGGLLGIIVAFFCYRQFFPSPYDLRGFEPYVCLATMEDEAIHTHVDQERAHVTYDPEIDKSSDLEAQNNHPDR